MQKNFQENFGVVEVNEVTNEYYIKLPEWIVNEMNWYDGTEINIKVDDEDYNRTRIKNILLTAPYINGIMNL